MTTTRITALVAAILVGKRKGYGTTAMPPHNMTYTFIGATMLWMGWFGFNAGSAFSASPLAALAFVNTSTPSKFGAPLSNVSVILTASF